MSLFAPSSFPQLLGAAPPRLGEETDEACTQVPTRGLLNVVAAPQLSEASTYAALRTSHPASLKPSPTEDTQLLKLHTPPVMGKTYTAQLTHQSVHESGGRAVHLTHGIDLSKSRLHQQQVHAAVTVVSDWMMEHHSR